MATILQPRRLPNLSRRLANNPVTPLAANNPSPFEQVSFEPVPATSTVTGQPPVMAEVGVSAPAAPVTVPSLPGYAANPGGLVGQDQKNIEWLLNPSFDTSEVFRNSAERGVGSGTSGSGFGLNNKALMLDSEKIARAKLGHELLDPYLNRDSNERMAAAANQNRLDGIAAEGAAAMERLRLSEAGLSSRLSEQQKADLQLQILRGQQAQDLARLNTKGNIDQATIQSWLSGNGGGGSGGGGGGGGGGSVSGRTPASATAGTRVGATGGPFMGGFYNSSTDAFGNPMSAPGFQNPNAAGTVNPVAAGYGGGGSRAVTPGSAYNNISQLAQEILNKYTTT